MKKLILHSNGQALLTLVIYVSISIIIVSSAVIMLVLNSASTDTLSESTDAYYISESGIENALIRLLRDPSYSGETLAVNGGSATIQISGQTTKTITSIGRSGNFIRRINMQVTFINDTLVVQSQKEVF